MPTLRRESMSARYDIAVVGSGFAGSLMAMIARRLGYSVVLIERGKHPRVVIGESSTPLCNLLLENLAVRYDLPLLRPLTKWGSWQQSYPEVPCGLKRGFSFFHHDLDGPKGAPVSPSRRLLVAASPNDAIADTHWYRAAFDELLVRQAQELGVEYIDQVELRDCVKVAAGWALQGTRGVHDIALSATFMIDATGPRGFLHRALALDELPLPGLPHTAALYSHFSGVQGFAEHSCGKPFETPYPINDAALHHVFDGGWIWVLRFNNGVTSAGVAASTKISDRYRFESGEDAWRRLLAALPLVEKQFSSAVPVMPFTYAPKLSFHSATIAGSGWTLLPSSAGFVDPLLSTGFPLTLLGVTRLAEALEKNWQSPRLEADLQRYSHATREELLATGRLIGALYDSMGDFPLFQSLSLLYFSAASYAETMRRLDKPEQAKSFLLHDDAVFGPESRRILDKTRERSGMAATEELQGEIYKLVEKFDVAGLSRRPQDHSYPVRGEDLLASADKVGASRQEIESLLRRSGFYAAAS